MDIHTNYRLKILLS